MKVYGLFFSCTPSYKRKGGYALDIIQCLYYRNLRCDCECLFKGITCDSRHIYLTCPSRSEIVKLDKCFVRKNVITVCKPYTSICFDEYNNCFWALSVKDRSKIYKLDYCFDEIDCMSIRIDECPCIQLSGVTCKDCCTLIVCGNIGIAEISKRNGECIKILCRETLRYQYSCVCCGAPGMVTAMTQTQTYTIAWNDLCNCNAAKCCLPDCYHVDDIAICCFDGDNYVYALVTKNMCYSYVLCIKLYSVPMEPCSCCDSYDTCCGCSENDCKKADCSEGAANIIESIALVEAALSHILNAEGEKIQHILCETDDTCKILQVNEAVQKTITSITHLEQVLYSKLQTAQELCTPCDCTKKCNECDNT